jgi:hypothetical protein
MRSTRLAPSLVALALLALAVDPRSVLGHPVAPPPALPKTSAGYRTYDLAMARHVFVEKFWTWTQFPGLSGRRETRSGLYLSQARNTVDAGGKKWQTWSASFFNAPAALVIQRDLFPPAVFQQRIITPGAKVLFPKESIVVKALFTENVQPGMHVVTAHIAKVQGGSATKNGHLVPALMEDKQVGLLQLDIATKQAADWVWMTFSFQPDAVKGDQLSTASYIKDPVARPDGFPGEHPGTLAVVKAGGLYAVGRASEFTTEYRGPADNEASTCIACHQHVQYPPPIIGEFTRDPAHKQHHPGAYPIVWPGETTPRLGVRLDYQWEAAQALAQWDLDEEKKLPHSLHARPEDEPGLKGLPGNNNGGGGIIGGVEPTPDDFDNH